MLYQLLRVLISGSIVILMRKQLLTITIIGLFVFQTPVIALAEQDSIMSTSLSIWAKQNVKSGSKVTIYGQLKGVDGQGAANKLVTVYVKVLRSVSKKIVKGKIKRNFKHFWVPQETVMTDEKGKFQVVHKPKANKISTYKAIHKGSGRLMSSSSSFINVKASE